MKQEKVTFKISRFKPGTPHPPRFQTFELDVTKGMTILDCLEQIRLYQDASLMYRRSCHHASCGTCAIIINGTEMLACTTQVGDLETHPVILEPLENFDRVGDLAVDMTSFFKALPMEWCHVQSSEQKQSISGPKAVEHMERFENCIECGACYSSCPVVRKNTSFLGPAVLAAVHRQYIQTGQKEALNQGAGKFGEGLCERATNCSRVCPAGVQPARQILDLRQLLEAYPAEER